MKLPIARAGIPWISVPLCIAITLWLWLGFIWSLPLWILTAFLTNFFRDPERISWETESVILAPADGRIIEIGPSECEGEFHQHVKISIFMNVFSVHVNRSPFPGTVRSIESYKGKFLAAWDPASSIENERTEMIIHTSIGAMKIRLVAGLVARRIVSYVSSGQDVDRGARIGMIKLGSRVDLYIPNTCRIEVGIGDRVQAGISRLAIALKPSPPTSESEVIR